MRKCNVALIEEPWTYRGEIKRLKEVGGELIYSRSTQNPRTCIYGKKGFRILPLIEYCSRDLAAVKIKSSNGERQREIILGWAYLTYDDVESPSTRELDRLVAWGRDIGAHPILGCDANSHHTYWVSTNIKSRDESLLYYVTANGLEE
jgi:hypothetical protein